jgi:uncharacterized protein YndB with AHSA1/START domain
MNEINHQVGIKSSANMIYQLLTTDKGLSGWWTHETDGAGDVGAIINFRFNETVVQFQVAELIANEKVVWKHYGAMPEGWMGTEVVFQLDDVENQTFVRFSHKLWKQSCQFMAHCNTKWAVFMLSLKDLAEKGVGIPFPNDIQIDHS